MAPKNTKNQEIKHAPIKFSATDEMVRVLGADMYENPLTAIAELCYNGGDAALRQGVIAQINVRLWGAGEHPLSRSAPAISITDNGCGFTDDVVAQYSNVGKSAQIGHGRKGIGKLAAFSLMRDWQHSQYHIITAVQNEVGCAIYGISPQIFSQGEITPLDMTRSAYPELPARGPFSQIFIPDWNCSLSSEELVSGLGKLLPLLSNWKVTVNNVPVVNRQPEKLESYTTPHIKAIGGTITFHFGCDRKTRDRVDSVMLCDGGHGQRPVAKLRRISAASRLDNIFRDVRLVGSISVPHLQDFSTASREGLTAPFWSSQFGEATLTAINVYGAELAAKVLGRDGEKTDSVTSKYAGRMVEDFSKIWGTPTEEELSAFGTGIMEPADGMEKNPNPADVDIMKPFRNQRRKRDDLSPDKRGRPAPILRRKRQAHVVKIENKVYQIQMGDSPDNPVSSEIRDEDQIWINYSHPCFKRAEEIGESALRDYMNRVTLEAHIVGTFENVKESKSTVESAMKFRSEVTELEQLMITKKK